MLVSFDPGLKQKGAPFWVPMGLAEGLGYSGLRRAESFGVQGLAFLVQSLEFRVQCRVLV